MEPLHQPNATVAHRYRILDILGQGSVGTTYAAEDLETGHKVALKALSLHRLNDWKQLQLFEREAQTLAKLNHPGIPHYLNYFYVDTSSDRLFYIAQELAEGKNLAALAKTGWRTNEAGVRKIAAQVLAILTYLHSLKPPVVHRDIKPQNLIMGQDERLFLVDFGSVQNTYYNTFMRGSTLVGTYGYMAPEQFRGQSVPATDLYALGATLLFLLTHQSPSDLPHDRLKISFRSRIQVTDAFADWLEKLLEPDVEDRFGSAQEALAVLQGQVVVGRRSFRPWRAIAAGVLLTATVYTLNTFKYSILATLCGHNERYSSDCDFASMVIAGGVARGDRNALRAYFKTGYTPYQLFESNAVRELLSERAISLNWSEPNTAVELLLESGFNINETHTRHGTALLHEAILNLNGAEALEAVRFLIARGANTNIRDRYGETPLHLATWQEEEEIIEFLVTQGANVNAQDSNGWTALHHLLFLSLPPSPVVNGSVSSPASEAIASFLIAQGADVDTVDIRGNTVLHFSALPVSSWERPIMKLLIAAGANVNAVDATGRTALHLVATSCRDPDSIKLLIESGADVDAKDSEGKTALHYLIRPELLEEVCTEYEDLYKDIYKGQSRSISLPFVSFVDGCRHPLQEMQAIRVLLAAGAEVNARDQMGNTPFHYAQMIARPDIVELLREHGGTE